jgi:lysophospholipase L1-like esterase
VSDYAAISERSATRLRFIRPVASVAGYEHCSPGSRLRFVTNSDFLRLSLFWNALVTRLDTFNSVGSVLVDGVEHAQFGCPVAANVTAAHQPVFSLPTGSKTVEVIWPYGAGLDCTGVEVAQGSTFTAPAARPTAKIIGAGDSITHGYTVPRTVQSYVYSLAVGEGKQIVNIANGGDTAVAANGNAVPLGLGANDRILYFIGFNNFYPQVSIGPFQTQVEGWITNARARAPTTPIYVGMHRTLKVAADYSGTIEPATYRAAVQAAEAAAGDANTFYVDGHALVTADPSNFTDGIHFSSLGAAAVSTALEGVI